MLGPFINGAAIAGGAVFGAAAGKLIPERIKSSLPLTFGVSAISIGVTLIMKISLLPPVILAVLVGSLVGEFAGFETFLGGLAVKVRVIASRRQPAIHDPASDGDAAEFVERYVALVVLFCASAMGIFGSIDEGLGNGITMLSTKAILDFFTAVIFAANLGFSLAFIAIPQLAVQSIFFFLASLVAPLMTPAAMGNFSACGGVLMIATGLRICGIKNFPIANMLPALLFVVPFTALWGLLF